MNDEKAMIMCEAGISGGGCSGVRVPLGPTLDGQRYPILTTRVDVVG